MLIASELAFSPPAAAQTQPFTDTSSDAYYSDAVAALADSGIFDDTECAESMLCPQASIDRKTMAVWTVRALDGQDPAQASDNRFTDVDANSFHAPFIERMAELGVTTGCGNSGNSTFCPDDTVTRDQMAVFLTRAFNLDPGPDPGFTDVAPNAWYYTQTAALAASGITAGCGDGTTFCPNQHTTRAQMATFLARALGLVDKPTPPATGYQDIAVGTLVTDLSGYACGLRTDGTMTCWGHIGDDSDDGVGTSLEIDAPQGAYKALSSDGFYNLCAVGTDDIVTCWATRWSDSSDPGLMTWTTSTDTPQGTYKSVAAGARHTCAIGTDNTITCWGDLSATDTPDGTFKAIAAERADTCAIGTDDTITCWGDLSATDAPDGTFKAIAARSSDTCAIGTDDTITCWGYGTDAPDGTYKAIALGTFHACAIGTDDTITCWGANEFGQTDAPQGSYKAIASGYTHTCAIGTDDTITCWGASLQSDDCCGGASPRGW